MRASAETSESRRTRRPKKPAALPTKPTARPGEPAARSTKPAGRVAKAAAPAPEGNVVVRKSAIQGRGVFATRDIPDGERIVEYLGERISHEEASGRYDDEAVRRHHTFLFSVNDEICIDGGRGGNEARFINHSCDPNAYAMVAKKRIFILASRDIEAGEEILYDYWYSTDPEYTDEDRRRLYPCRCGAVGCRGMLAAPAKKPRAKAKRTARRNGSR